MHTQKLGRMLGYVGCLVAAVASGFVGCFPVVYASAPARMNTPTVAFSACHGELIQTNNTDTLKHTTDKQSKQTAHNQRSSVPNTPECCYGHSSNSVSRLENTQATPLQKTENSLVRVPFDWRAHTETSLTHVGMVLTKESPPELYSTKTSYTARIGQIKRLD